MMFYRINPAERPNVIQLLSHKFINGDSVERPMSLPDEERIKTKGRLTTAGSYTSRHKKTESLNLKNNEKPEL